MNDAANMTTFIASGETRRCGNHATFGVRSRIVSSRHRTTEAETLSEASTVAGEVKMATRAASKQQELEEQLAKLVGLMEQQRQRQEQLAGGQRQRQEELADEQRQRQEVMAQQQTEKLNHLMGEQQLQGKLLLQQQREAEEQMDAIKDDLSETKVIMKGRFHAAEETLEVMRRQLSED